MSPPSWAPLAFGRTRGADLGLYTTGGTFVYSSAIADPNVGVPMGLTVTGTANTNYVQLTGNNTYTGTTNVMPGGALMIGDGKTVGEGLASPSIVLTGSGEVIFSVGDTMTYAGNISGGLTATALVNVSKAGSGTVIFSGNNTYVGATTVAAGTLKFGNNTVLPGAMSIVPSRRL